jgi:hypothetical protein
LGILSLAQADPRTFALASALAVGSHRAVLSFVIVPTSLTEFAVPEGGAKLLHTSRLRGHHGRPHRRGLPDRLRTAGAVAYSAAAWPISPATVGSAKYSAMSWAWSFGLLVRMSRTLGGSARRMRRSGGRDPARPGW